MSSFGLSPTDQQVLFKKQLRGRQGALGVQLYGTKDPAVLSALATNTPFPTGRDFELGSSRLRASTGKEITFSNGAGNVTFSAEGGGFAALGIYRSFDAAVQAMELDDRLNFKPESEPPGKPLYLVLQWGYDVAASGGGKVALGPVPVTFGAKGDAHRKFVVLRQTNQQQPAMDALTALLDSWTVPSLVKSAADMEPGSWIITELNGSVSLSVAATYGYDFSWVREAEFGGLQGTIGLKVQAGLSAALGFEAAGSYLLALGRESQDAKLRMRLFRQKKNGLAFAFNAGVRAQAQTGPFTKENFNQLVLAALGLHHQQLIQDLQLVAAWAGGNQSLSGIFGKLGGPYVDQLFRRLADTPAGQQYEAARSKVAGFLNEWENIDQRLTTEIWHLMGEYKDSLDEAKSITTKIATAKSAEDYLQILNQYIPQPAFLVSPVGRWLELFAADKLLKATGDNVAFQEVKSVAQKLVPILGYATDPKSVLTKLKDYVDEKIGLKRIEDAVDQASLDNLDQWVQAKIAKFLDEEVANLDSVKRVQEVIKLILEKKDQFIAKAAEIAQKQYEADFAFAYQSSTVRQALLDVEFDFTTENPSQYLTDAISGNFDQVLLKPLPGVVLHQGVLSHEVKRNRDVQLSLPYYKWKSNHLNQSLAKITSSEGITAGDHALNVEFGLDSQDETVKLVNSGGSLSRLSLSSNLHAVAKSGILVFDDTTLKFSYSFRKAARDMSRDELLYQVGPPLEMYLPKAFPDGRIAEWTAQLDDAVPYGRVDRIGDVLFRLQLEYESALLSGWFNAPERSDDVRYKMMSTAIQASLKTQIPLFFFRSRDSFDDFRRAWVLSVYASIPPMVGEDVYWNFRLPALLSQVLNSEATSDALRTRLSMLARLARTAGSDSAEMYDVPVTKPVAYALKEGRFLLQSMIVSELAVIRGAVDAGCKMASFRKNVQSGNAKLADALRDLAGFGAKITNAFNNEITGNFGDDEVRSIGALVYAEAASVLGDRIAFPAALAELTVLQQNSGFDMQKFIGGIQPNRSQVLLSQAVVNA